MKVLKALGATLLAMLIGIVFFIITELSVVILNVAYNKTGNAVLDWITAPQEPDRLYLVVYPLTILIYCLIFFIRINKNKVEADVHWDIKTGIICSIMAGIAFGGISTLWVEFLKHTPLSGIRFIKSSLEYLTASSGNRSAAAFTITILVAGILGPVTEELIYRGVIFRFLERRVNSIYALIVSSLLFGIVHMSFVQSVYAGIMGLIAGIVYMKTRKLIWPVIIHITINTLASFELTSNLIWVTFTILMFIPLGNILYRLLKTKAEYAY